MLFTIQGVVGSESAGLQQGSGNVLVRLRNPRAERRRCSKRPLIATVGPLDVLGRSK